jgi:predicted PurR-regulated permease PerM
MQSDVNHTDDQNGPRWNLTIRITVAVIALVLILIAAYAFRIAFVPLIIGSLIAYILTPVVKWINKVTRLPKGLATLVVFFALLALLIPVGTLVLPELSAQVSQLYNDVIAYVEELQTRSTDTVTVLGFKFAVGDLVDEATSSLAQLARSAAPHTVGLVVNAARTGLLIIFTLFIGFYLTRDGDKFIAALKQSVPPDYREDAARLMADIDHVWSSFLRGQVILSLTVVVILTIVSTALGLPQPLLLGILGGLLEFLPSIGNMIWGLTAILVAIVEGSGYLPLPPTAFVIVVALTALAFSQLDTNVLIPNIIGGQVKLHPVVVLIGVIIGLNVAGVLGVALAAPTIASLRVIGRYLYARVFDLDPFPPDQQAPIPTGHEAAGQEGPDTYPLPDEITAAQEDTG